MTTPEKISVVLVTNWRIDVIQGRTYGVCSVNAPEEFKEMTFKRGFPLTDPTHTRCAVFAVVLGMEQTLCSKELCSGKFRAAIVTKSKVASDMLIGAQADGVRRWADNPSQKPLKKAGFSKKFMLQAFGMLDTLRRTGIADVVFVDDSDDEKHEENLLTAHTVHLDIDPEKDYDGSAASSNGDADELKASSAKHRNLLRQELLALGVRSSRAGKMLTKRQRQEIAKTEGVSDKKKKEDQDRKPATPTTCDAEPVIHSGLAAAIAAEELRAAATAVAASANAGHGVHPTSGDGAGDVQESEHGACGGNRESPQGIGERKTTTTDTPEHVS